MSVFSRFVDWYFDDDSGSDGRATEPAERQVPDDLDAYSLYEIGDYMCRYYPDGLTIAEDVHQWDEYSMSVVVDEWLGDRDLTTDLVRELDRLLDDAVVGPDIEAVVDSQSASTDNDPTRSEDREVEHTEMVTDRGVLLQSKVEDFRRVFFERFGIDEHMSVIQELYSEAVEQSVVHSVAIEQAVDGHQYVYQTGSSEPQAMVGIDSTSSSVDRTTFDEEYVDMMNVGAGIDLVESSVTATVDEFVAEEASLFWSTVDEPSTIETSIDDEIYEARMVVEEAYFTPDTAIFDEHGRSSPATGPLGVHVDETGEMTTPFVVLDSSNAVYRLTASPISVEDYDGVAEPYRYVLRWTGNYEVVHDDAICGPCPDL